MIIGATGLGRAGKDTLAKQLVKRYGFGHLDFFEDAVKPELERRGFEITKMNGSILGDQMRKEEGMDVMAKRIFDKINLTKDTVITGFRSPEEVNYIKKHTSDFILVEIYTKEDVRYERTDKKQTKEEFLERDKQDIKLKGLGKVVEMADFRIVNDTTRDEFEKNIKEFMKKLGVGK